MKLKIHQVNGFFITETKGIGNLETDNENLQQI